MVSTELRDDLLPDAAAAAHFLGEGFDRSRVYHLVRIGQLRAIKKGSRLYFRKSWLVEDFSDASPAAAE